MSLQEDWEFNVLGAYNYRKPGPLQHYFDFIAENHDRIDGDILEAGVYQGRSLLGAALLLKELGSKKTVYGFDTFSGFPPVYHENDDLSKFDWLYEHKRISAEHREKVRRNVRHRSLHLGERRPATAANLSLSGDFSNNCREQLERKLEYLKLDNVKLIAGPFSATMLPSAAEPRRIMAALLDCDLYESYCVALPFLWPRMSTGGYLALDEYYSLKFPGARIATDEFFAGKGDGPQRHKVEPMDFERWYVRKLAA
jgi:hypothetical protein